MSIIRFTEDDIEQLKNKDARLSEFIDRIGAIERQGNDNIFLSIVEAIISQQLSSKVADVIIRRFYDRFDIITPETIISLEEDDIKRVGLSSRKVRYIKSLANVVAEGKLDLESLRDMSDNEVIDQLIMLDGIGRWTAEMLLIFTLKRRDVLPVTDLGIRRGLQHIYGEDVDYSEVKNNFSPYNTLLSFYLWEIGK